MIAVYIDNKVEKYYEEIYYTLDFVFKTLGYEFKCITKLDQLNENDILFYYGLIEPNIREAHILAFDKIMFYIPIEIILYSTGTDTEQLKSMLRSINLPEPLPFFSKRAITTPVLYSNNDDLYYGKFQFDIFANIFLNLVNYHAHSSFTEDNFGKMADSNTFLHEYSLFSYINVFLWLIDNFLQNSVKEKKTHFLVKKEFWPSAENFAVAVSHTIDRLQKWNTSSIFSSTFNELMMFYKVQYNLKSFFSKSKYMITNIEEYWNFEEIYEIEDKYKIKSTYFWGVESDSNEDVDYNIEEPDIAEEMRKIKDKGNEIALLASAKSYRSDSHSRQKKVLLKAINDKNIGVRQKKFKYDFEVTPELHNKNEYIYDSSMSFLNHIGFKNGIGFPYRIFSQRKKNKTRKTGFYFKKNCLEIPLSFSDNALKISRTKVLTYEKAIELMNKLIKAMNSVNGLLTLDFSISNFANVNYAPILFEETLEILKQKKVFWGTYQEIAEWWKKRETVLIKELSKDIFSIYFPTKMKKISISLFGNFDIEEIKGAKSKVENNRVIFENIKADTTVIIELQEKEEKVIS